MGRGTLPFVSIRQRAYPTVEQLAVFGMHCDQARYVYNLALEHHQLAYRHQRSYEHRPGYRDRCPGSSSAAQSKMLTEARLPDVPVERQAAPGFRGA